MTEKLTCPTTKNNSVSALKKLYLEGFNKDFTATAKHLNMQNSTFVYNVMQHISCELVCGLWEGELPGHVCLMFAYTQGIAAQQLLYKLTLNKGILSSLGRYTN